MAKNILITGASGLIGSRLTFLLKQKGYQVSHLSRAAKRGLVKTYEWDVKNGQLDPKAIEDCDAIIHLAGAGIADKRWTNKRKTEILESRTHSTALLSSALKNHPNHVKSFITASAIGYYGFGDEEKLFKEDDKPGSDFLSRVVKAWEEQVDEINSSHIRGVKLRLGIVLSAKGGALAEMVKPIRWGVGSPLGSGKQPMSWIHIDDVCGMFIHALENELIEGIYNAVSDVASNTGFTEMVAKVLQKPLWLPNVPAFVLRIILGEMADLVLQGNRVSSKRVQESGYLIKYPDLDMALQQLLVEDDVPSLT